MKATKKIREILKLEERLANGERLESKQQEKVGTKAQTVQDLCKIAQRLPGSTEVLNKCEDIAEFLPREIRDNMQKKHRQEQARVQRREEEERAEKERKEYMPRHERPITDIAVSHDGRHLFTSAKDSLALGWSLDGPHIRAHCTFGGHNGAVWAVSASAPIPRLGPLLATGSADGKVCFWNAGLARVRKETVLAPTASVEHGGIVRVVRWCPFDADADLPRLATASEKLGERHPPAIVVWRLTARGGADEVLRITDLPTKANDLRWASGAKMKILSAHDNGYIGVWSAEAPGTLLKTVRLHTGPVMTISITADSKTLLTASLDRTGKAVDISTAAMETLATYSADRPLRAVAASPDYVPGAAGKVIFGGGREPREVTTSQLLEDEFEAAVLDGESKEWLASGRGHIGPVHRTLALPDCGPAGGFATVSEDGCLKVHGLDGTLLHADTL